MRDNRRTRASEQNAWGFIFLCANLLGDFEQVTFLLCASLPRNIKLGLYTKLQFSFMFCSCFSLAYIVFFCLQIEYKLNLLRSMIFRLDTVNWLMIVIIIILRLSQEYCHKFKSNLAYIVSSKPALPQSKIKQSQKGKKNPNITEISLSLFDYKIYKTVYSVYLVFS